MVTRRHDHRKVFDEPAPEVAFMEVMRVTFRRGTGCCEESPVRMVTAYYLSDGQVIAEFDPERLP
jgi:hypothetical protein